MSIDFFGVYHFVFFAEVGDLMQEYDQVMESKFVINGELAHHFL